MIRVAAVGDVHYGRSSRHDLRDQFRALSGRADLLLIAGDLTQSGSPEEARALTEDLGEVKVPIIAVLGNHDFQQNRQEEIRDALRSSGIFSLEGDTAVVSIRGYSVGVVGLKGFGGGFFGACVSEFGENETKSFAHHGRVQAEILRAGLRTLQADFRFVLIHYSPIEATLLGERREIYPFLGSYLLAEAVDSIGADAVFHGHAHKGVERGSTPGGIPVRNVAAPVIRHAYNIYTFESHSPLA